MRKFLTIFLLCMAVIVNAQTKPASPALQPVWSDSCVRALPLHEGTGTTVDDMSPVNAACSISPSDNWDSDAEGNFVNTSLVSNSYISLASGLPGAGVDSLTWYMRIKWLYTSTTGQTLGANFTNGPPPKTDLHWFGEGTNPAGNPDVFKWVVKNGSGTQQMASSTTTWSNGTKYNLIGTYDGANIKIYINGALEGTTALTGNIANDGYTTRIGNGINEALDADATTSQFTSEGIYTICIWRRVISSSEIAAIQADPYVMFHVATVSSHRNVIVIQSMLPNIDSMFYLITYLSLIGIIAGIYKFFWQEKRLKRAGNR